MSNSGDFMIVAPYNWTLKNVERNVQKTFASKMILFRGERVFRVGLKNDVKTNKQTLFFMSIYLNKIGLTVKEVVYCYTTEDSATKSTLATEIRQQLKHIKMNNRKEDNCSLQLFTSELNTKVSGNGTFAFRIYIDGISNGYRYQFSDRLLKQQLWAAVKNQQRGTDVELLVKGTTFSAHKAILAARSPVFTAEFLEKEQSGDVPYQLKIDDVDPSTVEQFLYFLYTGESMTPNLANKELLTLAEIYKLTTLADLCQNSLKEVTTQQLASIGTALNKQPTAVTECPLEIKQEKDTEIFFDQNISIFSLTRSLFSEAKSPVVLFQCKHEDTFFVQLDMTDGRGPASVQFVSANYLISGLQPVEVTHQCNTFDEKHWEEMNQRKSLENAKWSLFTSISNCWNLKEKTYHHSICFRIKLVTTIENNCFEMVDTNWSAQLWLASTKRQLTDVDVNVGEKKLEAHRVILCARSPVFCTLFSKIGNTLGKPTIAIGAEFELANVEQFLKFLYTGSLDILANKQLLALAELYEVETLKKICRANNQNNPDVEDLTNSLLAL